MKKQLVKDYIENLKEQNSESKVQQLRPNLFYCSKLDEMVFMEKLVNTRTKISNIYLYIMEKRDKISKEKLSQMTEAERKEFVLNNLHNYYVFPEVSIANMCNYEDKPDWSDSNADYVNRLSILKVHQYFRRLGLAQELIRELRSETLNNGYSSIIARMAPLDNFDLGDLRYIQKSHDIEKIKKDLILQNSVDIHALARIYKHLGFVVSDNYTMDKSISMHIGPQSVSPEYAYPKSFTDYSCHPTELLVR